MVLALNSEPMAERISSNPSKYSDATESALFRGNEPPFVFTTLHAQHKTHDTGHTAHDT